MDARQELINKLVECIALHRKQIATMERMIEAVRYQQEKEK